MKETFETNLSTSQKEEMAAQQAYEDLKAAKEAEIKAGTEQKDQKTQELADTDEKLAQDKQDLEETRAVSEALAILSSDDAHDTFTSTFNFVQTSAQSQESQNRDKAAKVLFDAAKKYGNPKLAAVATAVRLDAFTKVKAAIDEMINALLKEKA